LDVIKEEVDKTNTGVNLVEQEKLHYENQETNSKGSSITVTTVTRVTDTKEHGDITKSYRDVELLLT